MGAVFNIPGTQYTIGKERIFIIAEVGKNFIQTQEEQPVGKYLENAKALVKAAKEAGADAVKFQTHNVEDEQLNLHVVSPHFKAADRYSWISRNDRSTPFEAFWKPLKRYCDEIGIIFFSTPMSRGAAQKLQTLDPPLWKIGSGDVLDFVCLDYVCAQGKPVIISTGMVSLQELETVVRFITKRNRQLVVLYCISKYPCPPEEFNLGTIEYLRERYPNCIIGFSDHSIGFGVDLAAVKLGAKVIEKHFSFDRELWGADHKVSMTPQEMREMIRAIRLGVWQDHDVQKFYGQRSKELEGAHNQFRPYFHKSLMAGDDISAGTVLVPAMIYAMRPRIYAGGLPSEEYERVLGKRVKKDLKKYEPITADILE